tara:strand:- start:3339 stop:3734 length:396 start_codon:yes stop_codon:yes gene_type:complete
MSYVIDCRKCGKPFAKTSNRDGRMRCPECRGGVMSPSRPKEGAPSSRLLAVEERLASMEDDLTHVSQMANTATDTIVATALEAVEARVTALINEQVERLAKERMDRLLLTMRKHMLEHIDELHGRIDALEG